MGSVKGHAVKRVGSSVVRYAISIFIITWATVAQLAVGIFFYNLIASGIPGLPILSAASLTTPFSSPLLLIAGTIVLLFTVAVGRYRYGTLAAFTVAVAQRTDSILGQSVYRTPQLVGRVRHNDLVWRFKLFDGDHIETVQRECPYCGLEVTEALLPRERVHSPNTSVNPGAETRSTATEAWEDVYGREKADQTGEELALTCPDCQFSVPGQADVLTGQEGARAKFRKHIDAMRAGNTNNAPFAEYRDPATTDADTKPTPHDIWDLYVKSTSATDVLPISPELNESSQSSSVQPEKKSHTNRQDAEVSS